MFFRLPVFQWNFHVYLRQFQMESVNYQQERWHSRITKEMEDGLKKLWVLQIKKRQSALEASRIRVIRINLFREIKYCILQPMQLDTLKCEHSENSRLKSNHFFCFLMQIKGHVALIDTSHLDPLYTSNDPSGHGMKVRTQYWKVVQLSSLNDSSVCMRFGNGGKNKIDFVWKIRRTEFCMGICNLT